MFRSPISALRKQIVMRKAPALVLSLLSAGLLFSHSASATDGSWNADALGNWSDTTKWLNGIIADGQGSTANFTFNITAGRTITIDTTSRTVGIMNIGDSAGATPSNYTITSSGGASLIFDNGASNAQLNQTATSGNNTISAPVTLNSTLAVANASSNSLTMSGVLSGSGGLSLSSGSLAITGASANTYLGNTTLSGGRLDVNATGTLGSGTLVLSGGTLNVTVGSRSVNAPISNNISITANSAITTTATSASGASSILNLSGTVSGTAGTLTFQNNGASGNGVFDPRFSGGTFTLANAIDIENGAGTVTTRFSDFNTTGTTHEYDGVISGNGSYRRSASSSGTGGTTIFAASNTYTGGTTINDGTLQLGNGGTAGSISTSSAITISTGGTLAFNRSNAVVQGTDFGTIGGTGGGSVVQMGSGTTTLNVANTYSAGTTVSNGTLVATVGGALGTGNVSITGAGLRLTLGNGGVAQDYIANTATLSIANGASANLNFTGTDTVGNFVLNGVAQAAGVYNATTNPGVFTGLGSITNLAAIPEPATYMLMGLGGLLCVQALRRKRS